ncbi:MAG: hypothetical protein BroJett018_22110 [Chloroflexota bacterium]|nr:restriction endonuclease subunit S [Chloroflexota bacterium]NOG66110.1 restriction endonuclease subunit S [Chloroflexota bacterium]GIK64417.1 MAG: hypothetical protein BroJett018_22110 [Chloroflexota bacterium]
MSNKTALSEGWKTYRFDQMAENINERVLPADAEGLPYVGLEHLDSESLKIRRWGSPDEVEAQKLRFYLGDIIFGKRRYYQKKLAVADFDGICSAHAMVLRAKSDVVLPKFLPFFMQSEVFFERAIAISVGSLSPTINWTALARQEFPLPPLDEQCRIAEILWATEEAIEGWLTVSEQLSDFRGRLPTEKLRSGSEKQIVSVDDILIDIQYGSSVAAFETGQFPILRIPNVLNGEVDLADLKWIDLPGADFDRYALREGDILIVRTNGNPDYVGRSAVVDQTVPARSVFASYLIRLQIDQSRIRPDYLREIINSPEFRRSLRGEIKSSAGNYNLNTKGIKRQKITLPPIDIQDQLLVDLKLIDQQIKLVKTNIENLRSIKKRVFLESIGNA